MSLRSNSKRIPPRCTQIKKNGGQQPLVTVHVRKNRSTYPGTPGTAVLRTVIYIHIIHTDGTMVPCGLHLTERCSKRTQVQFALFQTNLV